MSTSIHMSQVERLSLEWSVAHLGDGPLIVRSVRLPNPLVSLRLWDGREFRCIVRDDDLRWLDQEFRARPPLHAVCGGSPTGGTASSSHSARPE